MRGEPGARRCRLGPSNPPRQAERPQQREAARPSAPTVPDAARRQGAASATTGRSWRRLPGRSEAPVPASAAAWDPEAGRALQDTERGAAEHDPPLRLPRSPQGQYARPRRAPASSQSTEVESQTAGWLRQPDDAGFLRESYSPARKDGGKRTGGASTRSYGKRTSYREIFKVPPKKERCRVEGGG